MGGHFLAYSTPFLLCSNTADHCPTMLLRVPDVGTFINIPIEFSNLIKFFSITLTFSIVWQVQNAVVLICSTLCIASDHTGKCFSNKAPCFPCLTKSHFQGNQLLGESASVCSLVFFPHKKVGKQKKNNLADGLRYWCWWLFCCCKLYFTAQIIVFWNLCLRLPV